MTRRPRPAPSYAALLLAAFASAGAHGQAARNPWLGTWSLKLSGPGEKPETLIYSDAGHGAMRMVSVEDRSELVTRFDGAPAPDTGAGATHRHALAVTATSPTSYSWTLFSDGEPRVRGRNTLAADHRSFTEVSWPIADPDRKLTFTYERR